MYAKRSTFFWRVAASSFFLNTTTTQFTGAAISSGGNYNKARRAMTGCNRRQMLRHSTKVYSKASKDLVVSNSQMKLVRVQSRYRERLSKNVLNAC
ncbi:hypothetical protein BKA82DRAFT_997788 [Pisolithus tinctorius]|uniref:Secreted protein n=1 Tax=Pisolithus tinctorius Marx 270 TaxID=870435 RepID=A0A0C3KDA1_PISTI|nr:hypothetical protein BKA82DRAFT_997788 [Pisolithus tinctorius]KIO07607.1 hypothetical protein M404DRAFT_997788 [Pisolithus tinctorius Marx 270]